MELNVVVGQHAFMLSGTTRSADLLDQLQLLAAHVRDPGFRPEFGEKLAALGGSQVASLEARPAAVHAREVSRVLSRGDARLGIQPSAADVRATRAGALPAILKPALADIVAAIEPEVGLFAVEREGETLSTAICVQDGELAGLFEVATAAAVRGQGFGRRVVSSALKWARMRGARTAWLQVEADNAPARALYDSLGYRELYRYHYRQPQP